MSIEIGFWNVNNNIVKKINYIPIESEEKLEEVLENDISDFVVTFGEGESRSWEDAIKYNFISAGNGKWYTGTLNRLNIGFGIFCMIPGLGYVGIGIVTSKAVPIHDAFVEVEGQKIKLS